LAPAAFVGWNTTLLDGQARNWVDQCIVAETLSGRVTPWATWSTSPTSVARVAASPVCSWRRRATAAASAASALGTNAAAVTASARAPSVPPRVVSWAASGPPGTYAASVPRMGLAAVATPWSAVLRAVASAEPASGRLVTRAGISVASATTRARSRSSAVTRLTWSATNRGKPPTSIPSSSSASGTIPNSFGLPRPLKKSAGVGVLLTALARSPPIGPLDPENPVMSRLGWTSPPDFCDWLLKLIVAGAPSSARKTWAALSCKPFAV
jgi:hypothetical protein